MPAELRSPHTLRPTSFELGLQAWADGSCLIRQGHTHVLCSASLEARVPGWMVGKGSGWITAEYGMLPAATHRRTDREAAKGKQQGRTVEIQRLIGRSLRQAVDLKALGERTLTIDCDVINADAGTRCAAITGGWVALALALRKHGLDTPLVRQVAALSVGILNQAEGRQGAVADLTYDEDHRAAVDANLVGARLCTGGDLELVELQATGEGRPYSRSEATALMDLGLQGIEHLMALQLEALK